MIVFLLLLILTVLLFGSSVVIGAAGYVLGFIAAFILLVWCSITFGWSPVAIVATVLGTMAIAAFAMMIVFPEEWAKAENDRKLREQAKRDAKKK
jgi:sugar phosphate permease